jgi:hypothetical protein
MEHTTKWEIHAYLFDHDEDSSLARVVLKTGANTLYGEGRAGAEDGRPLVAEIAEELALGRALVDLGSQLITAASQDSAALGGRAEGTDESLGARDDDGIERGGFHVY